MNRPMSQAYDATGAFEHHAPMNASRGTSWLWHQSYCKIDLSYLVCVSDAQAGSSSLHRCDFHDCLRSMQSASESVPHVSTLVGLGVLLTN